MKNTVEKNINNIEYSLGTKNIVGLTEKITNRYFSLFSSTHHFQVGSDIVNQSDDNIKKDIILFFIETILKNNAEQNPNIQVGDLVVNHSDYTIFEIKELNPIIRALRRKPTPAFKREQLNLADYVWIGRDNVKQLELKLNQYKQIGTSRLAFKNSKKIAILSDKADVLKLLPDYLPYHYINRNNINDPNNSNLDFFDPILIISNSFDSIKSSKYSYEYLIVIGNHADALTNISNACHSGKIKKCIFWGMDSINHTENFPILKWRWTLPEIAHFEGKCQSALATQVVPNEHFASFNNQIKELESNLSISLEELQKRAYRNWFRLIFEGEIESFQSHLLIQVKELLENEFYNIDYNGDKEINEIQKSCKEICNFLKPNSNPKYQYFKNLQKQVQYLVVPSKQKKAWLDIQKKVQPLKAEKVSNLDNLSLQLISRDTVHYSFKSLKETNIISFKEFKDGKDTEGEYFFLSLFGYGVYAEDLLNLVRIKNADATFLLFSEEKQILDWLNKKDYQHNINELQSEDRYKLTGVKFEHLESKSPNVDISEEWIELMLNGHIEKRFDEKSIYKYEIIFDGIVEKMVLFDNKTVFVENVESNKKKVKYLVRGDKTRIYQNPNKDILHEIFECCDNTDLFKRVNEKSNLWKKYVTDLQKEENLFDKDSIHKFFIERGISVSTDTFKNWIKDTSLIKFPKKLKDLAIIFHACKPNQFKELIKEYNTLMHEYNSKMVKSGADFSHEIEQYILTRKKGKMLDLLSDKHIENIIYKNAPLRTVKSITLIEDDNYE